MLIRAGHMLSWPAERYPDKIAITYQGQHMTFREVDRRVNRLAHGLLALGLQRGDRVAALLYNSPRAVEVRFALMKAGLCMVALNVRQTAAEHAYILNFPPSRLLILDAEYCATWEQMQTTCRGYATSSWQHLLSRRILPTKTSSPPRRVLPQKCWSRSTIWSASPTPPARLDAPRAL